MITDPCKYGLTKRGKMGNIYPFTPITIIVIMVKIKGEHHYEKHPIC
jgi:hypothetical protein